MSLEIISIHIPKTAGTSLMHTFKKTYGEERVVQLARKHVKEHDRNLSSYITHNTKVLHGHFFYSEIDPYLLDNRETKLIAFVRHPIDRVVSNYHHFIKTTKEQRFGSKQWFRRFESLSTYASRDHTRNMMCRYLKPFNWERFAFIGVQESYSEDLSALASTMKWEDTFEVKKNIHAQKNKLTKTQIDELTYLNKEDMALYNELLSMKQNTKWSLQRNLAK
ncbi:sulfotransferase family 2 domain-containing protein [Ekhidna sp. MALMAid0563]|uniref:sulfotransferase family 2 domain-containing protein n=1 Tax=Ekhidna sp. MALMAid0563 TaxID=3143937 RepID=UPI0032DF0F37